VLSVPRRVSELRSCSCERLSIFAMTMSVYQTTVAMFRGVKSAMCLTRDTDRLFQASCPRASPESKLHKIVGFATKDGNSILIRKFRRSGMSF
jgi:hypothetical protein